LEIEWTDIDTKTGERRFVCATKFARQWQFKIRFKRRTDWKPTRTVTREMWETLLDGLERRYWRREGVSEEDIANVKKSLSKLGPKQEIDGSNGHRNDE
jgi:hypothetical protein